jgi:hypothetical protein
MRPQTVAVSAHADNVQCGRGVTDDVGALPARRVRDVRVNRVGSTQTCHQPITVHALGDVSLAPLKAVTQTSGDRLSGFPGLPGSTRPHARRARSLPSLGIPWNSACEDARERTSTLNAPSHFPLKPLKDTFAVDGACSTPTNCSTEDQGTPTTSATCAALGTDSHDDTVRVTSRPYPCCDATPILYAKWQARRRTEQISATIGRSLRKTEVFRRSHNLPPHVPRSASDRLPHRHPARRNFPVHNSPHRIHVKGDSATGSSRVSSGVGFSVFAVSAIREV